MLVERRRSRVVEGRRVPPCSESSKYSMNSPWSRGSLSRSVWVVFVVVIVVVDMTATRNWIASSTTSSMLSFDTINFPYENLKSQSIAHDPESQKEISPPPPHASLYILLIDNLAVHLPRRGLHHAYHLLLITVRMLAPRLRSRCRCRTPLSGCVG